MITQGLYSILLLIVSNIFMTFAWYGHLKMREFSWFSTLPLIAVVTISWGIAFFEYSCQIPANRIGFNGNGGPFSLIQLKIIQEVITLVVFIVFTTLFFKGEVLHWNHVAAFVCLVLAVYFVFMK
ncbi:MAG: DMT family protein [Bacteroides sp.]